MNQLAFDFEQPENPRLLKEGGWEIVRSQGKPVKNPRWEKIEAEIGNFYGSETFTRWSPIFPKCVLTEGALFIAKEAQAYWLMDLIASWQHQLKRQEFQVWTLTVDLDHQQGMVICENGNGRELARQALPYTDFPMPELTLWAEANELGGITILLPAEH